MCPLQSLVVGMKLWGAIAEINKKDMIISLPGGLRGFVLAEEASEVFENAKGHSNKAKKQKKSGKKVEDNESDPVDLDKVIIFDFRNEMFVALKHVVLFLGLLIFRCLRPLLTMLRSP